MDVTVIVTAYNEAKFLPAALDSVLAQTRIPDEILVVDGGSTDGTRDTIRAYSGNYDLISAEFMDTNPNIPEMRNFAVKRASGELLTFLDGDDRFRPEKLACELSMYRSMPDIEVVFSNVAYIDSDGHMTGTWIENGKPPTGRVVAEDASREWPKGGLYRNELVSRNLLQEVGLYDERLPVYEDWDLKIRTAARTDVAYCPEVLTEYRLHEAGISRRAPYGRLQQATEHVYTKNEALLKAELNAEQFDHVRRMMRKHIYHHQTLAARNEGNYRGTISSYYRYLCCDPAEVGNVKMHLRVILPSTLHSRLKDAFHKLQTTVGK